MERLPEKFEEEVLRDCNIFWGNYDCYHKIIKDLDMVGVKIKCSEDEIANKAQKAMYLKCNHFTVRPILSLWSCWYFNGIEQIEFTSVDFCECIFKAVRSIYA